MGNSLFRVVEDYLVRGEEPSESAWAKLEKIASQYGITVEELLSRFR
jgi:hypothetical protein